LGSFSLLIPGFHCSKASDIAGRPFGIGLRITGSSPPVQPTSVQGRRQRSLVPGLLFKACCLRITGSSVADPGTARSNPLVRPSGLGKRFKQCRVICVRQAVSHRQPAPLTDFDYQKANGYGEGFIPQCGRAQRLKSGPSRLGAINACCCVRIIWTG
jgi:hypothetical protein